MKCTHEYPNCEGCNCVEKCGIFRNPLDFALHHGVSCKNYFKDMSSLYGEK